MPDVMTAMSERMAVYRLYDANDVLLYVGISKSFGRRWRSHRAEKPWWPEVHHQTIDWLETREEADEAETVAVLNEKPRYNIAKVPSLPPPRPLRRPHSPQQGGKSLTARSFVMAAKFSTVEAGIIDTARGDVTRSEWLRTVALAAAGQPVGARAPAGKPGSPPGRVPFRSPEPCPHPKARVHRGFCGCCGTGGLP